MMCHAYIHIHMITLHMDATMTQKMTREQKQMAKLLKKLRKNVMLMDGKKERWVDDTVHGPSWDAADLEALEMFREMKRREF